MISRQQGSQNKQVALELPRFLKRDDMCLTAANAKKTPQKQPDNFGRSCVNGDLGKKFGNKFDNSYGVPT